MSLTELIKTSMKYPFTDRNKLLTLGAIITIFGIITTIINYILLTSLYHINYQELSASTNVTSIQEVSNIVLTQIPTSTWIILAILTIISIIITIYISGYHLNVIKNSITQEYTLPDFNKPQEKIINGLKIIIVDIVYLIIPLLIIAVAMIPGGYLTLILSIIGAILLIYATLLSLMAIVNMAANNNQLKTAFQFKEIRNIIKDISWIRYIGTIFLIFLIFLIISLTAEIIISVIASGIAVLTNQLIIAIIIQTILLSLFVEPYIGLFINHAIGSLYNERISQKYDIDEEYLI